MPRISLTPLQLSRRILIGSAVAIAAYFAGFLPFPEPVHGGGLRLMLLSERAELLTVFLPLFLGIAYSYWNLARLGRGLNHLRFSDEELDEARSFVYQRWLTWVQFAVLLVMIGLSLADVLAHRHNNAILLLFAANPLLYVRSTLRRSTSSTGAARIDWVKAQPIHSDHWGAPDSLPHDPQELPASR